jgi:hypothetical protein
LSVDAIGRIQVLFPSAPWDSTAVSAAAPIAVELPPEAQGNPATFVALRSRWPFDFEALRVGLEWNYQDAWLLQPTAGDPLGALLDIADRITDGRPYDYGGVRYSRDGTVAALGALQPPDVCLSCVHHEPPVVAAAPVAGQTNTVDCSNASLTNAFCGVSNGSVSITNEAAPPAAYEPPLAPAAVYVPYYVPIVVHSGRPRFAFTEPREHAMHISQQAAAFPIPPRLIVPSSSQLQTFTGRHPARAH